MIKSLFILLIISISININAQNKDKDAPDLYNILKSGMINVEESNYTNALSDFKKLAELAEKQKNYRYLVVANLNFGNLYWKLSDHEMALTFFLQALDVANKYSIENLYSPIYNNIGIIYSENNQYEKAYEYFYNAYEISIASGIKNRIGMNLINLANVNKKLNKYDEAVKNLNEALLIFNNIQDSSSISIVYNNLGEYYLKFQRFEEAKDNLKKAFSYANANDKYYQSVYLLNIGQVYYGLNLFDTSIYYLEKCLAYSLDINHKENTINAYKYLAQNYSKMDNTRKSFEYLNKSNSWKDSLLVDKKKEWVSEVQIKYELEKVEKEVDFLEKQKKLQNIIWILSTLSILSFLLFAIYSLKSRNIKAKQRNKLLLKEKEVFKLQEEESKARADYLDEQIKTKEKLNAIKEEQYKIEIQYKNKDLTAKAKYLVNKNKTLADVNEKIKLIEPGNVSDTTKQLNEIMRFLKQNLNEEENWENFKIYFDELYHNFFNNLLKDFSNLSQDDMRLCAYIVMDMQTNEIAEIFNISPSSVRKRKQRFLEKIDIQKDIEITSFLKNYL